MELDNSVLIGKSFAVEDEEKEVMVKHIHSKLPVNILDMSKDPEETTALVRAAASISLANSPNAMASRPSNGMT